MLPFYLAKSTLSDPDNICNNFLWGEEGERKKLHLVSRQTTFLPKSNGGPGIRSQVHMNLAFMAKLGWKIAQEPPIVSVDCIRSKYLHRNNVTSFKNGSVV